jgi:uncharacterized protein (DUF1697 family)
MDKPFTMISSRSRRYAAFLRGVSPVNAKMAELRKAFEAAGFADVATVLSSGNVVFSGPPVSEGSLERKAEAAMGKHLGQAFLTFVRSVDALRKMLASDPYKDFRLKPGSKRIVTFLRGNPKAKLKLPIEFEGARILVRKSGEIFSAYAPNPKGPVFMALLEKTFGKEITTRTWDTVAKVAK